MKQRIKINEGRLRQIIKESVKKVLMEDEIEWSPTSVDSKSTNEYLSLNYEGNKAGYAWKDDDGMWYGIVYCEGYYPYQGQRFRAKRERDIRDMMRFFVYQHGEKVAKAAFEQANKENKMRYINLGKYQQFNAKDYLRRDIDSFIKYNHNDVIYWSYYTDKNIYYATPNNEAYTVTVKTPHGSENCGTAVNAQEIVQCTLDWIDLHGHYACYGH